MLTGIKNFRYRKVFELMANHSEMNKKVTLLEEKS